MAHMSGVDGDYADKYQDRLYNAKQVKMFNAKNKVLTPMVHVHVLVGILKSLIFRSCLSFVLLPLQCESLFQPSSDEVKRFNWLQAACELDLISNSLSQTFCLQSSFLWLTLENKNEMTDFFPFLTAPSI